MSFEDSSYYLFGSFVEMIFFPCKLKLSSLVQLVMIFSVNASMN